ncbi:phosphate signaling complex protein PhoU [Mycolicibacterium sp. 120270]|uniref:phosphate signaling complex protein PhoU n=1 Tax=Mycolicibacterium sp. 120270 TaxID=3090600 RepID=UPI00299F29FE|nr:phosphate signaling complex protein PhoU [Mycolicibacterium sp. 120270]MDX1886406.1 phosphate signaling complex protein PhoU [Mycolicibacterium sp. 120270]
MRTAYREQLAALCDQLAEMCGMAADAMLHASNALLLADLELAEQVISDHDRISDKWRRAEESAVRLLALQQPVAGDLRKVVGSLHVGADIERMGALAVHVANIARRRHPHHAVPDEVRGLFTEMADVAVQLARTAQEVLRSPDPKKAAQLRDKDDVVDTRHRHLFTVLMDREWQSGVCSAVDVALLGRFYERFADHAVEIGRRVVFEATGGLPMHKQLA